MSAEAKTSTGQGAGYLIAHRDDLERTGNWTLVCRSLGCQSFGTSGFEPMGWA